MSERLLSIERVSRHFGGVHALSDVSLDVVAGEVHALIGPNGAGKTTLIHQISGAQTPDSGAIHFAGKDITRVSMHERVAIGVARSWQITNVFGRLSALDNVALAVQGRQRDWGSSFRFWAAVDAERAIIDEAASWLAEVGLAGRESQLAGSLAHGEQRQLELALALATKPSLLLLDEPTRGIDVGAKNEIYQVLYELAERGVAMVDAPVSGAQWGAEAAELVFMVGGSAADLQRVRPLLERMGRAVHHVGPLGAGHMMKCINNLITSMTFSATMEGLTLGKRVGLDPAAMVAVLNESTGGSWITKNHIAQRVLSRSFDDPFKLELMLKDMGIANALARETGSAAPLAGLGQQLWQAAARAAGPEASVSELVRRRYFGRKIVARSDEKMIRHLNRIGGLLKHVHIESGGVYSAETARALRQVYSFIDQLANREDAP